ncbi:MAG TPA: right-handed parallel beta-helix repeat-containing protein [Bryobacteraceae bacterium]|nr:right-handed parallel beta-helix repeat-containing protein [Bryobacteraceae bacterium]
MRNHYGRSLSGRVLAALGALCVFGAAHRAIAATVCVNQSGSSGCQTTIGKAIATAASGDTIQVAAGTYKETVTIKTPVSLIGAGSGSTIIDATGLANGIVIDGTGINAFGNVVVSGFTVENANQQGILVENASNVTIWGNQVLNNDRALTTSATGQASCPGLPSALQSGENFDCGEGVNLTGVDHSVVSNNVIQNNSGGILLSDDIGPTFGNLVSGNLVSNNLEECGITLASHSGKGVYNNTVTGNQVSNNGTKLGFTGAGVGLFAPGPGDKTYGNLILNNTLTGNGHPGVTIHNHAAPPGAPSVDLNDNVIIGNTIANNAADTEDAVTPGTTGINIFSNAPITGTVISQNTINQEELGVVFNAPGGQVSAALNNFFTSVGIQNLGSGTITGTQNWWGCTGGPNTQGCALSRGAGITSAPFLTAAFNNGQLPAAPSSVTPPPPSGSGVTIVITGPGGATSSTNTFQVFSNFVTLDASKSTSSNTGPLTYSWAIAPGSPTGGGIVGANTATPTFQLTSPQTYQYILTVTDATGAKATATVTVQYI